MGKPKAGRPSSSGKPQRSGKHKKMKPTFESGSLLQPGKNKERQQNLEPKDIFNQEVPKKVREIMRMQTELKTRKGKKHKKEPSFFKHEKFKIQRGMSRPMKSAPKFVQGKMETDRHFINRVEKETHDVIMTTEMEQKYKIDLSGDGISDDKLKKKKSERKRERDKSRKKEKLQRIKEKKIEKKGDFSQLKDEVAFGEVVMQPPTLTAKPRKAVVDDHAKPGKRTLLLKQMIDKPVGGTPEQAANRDQLLHSHKHLANRKIGETVKRKHLSPAQKRISDAERLKAIESYRKLKEAKLNQT